MLNLWQKVALVLVGIAILCFLNGCGKGSEAYRTGNAEKLILRLAEIETSDLPSARGAREFARLVEQKSEGRIKIKVYDSGQLGQESSVIEQVRFGGIDFARVGLASLGNHSVQARMLTMPYVIRSAGQMWRIADGPIGDNIKEVLLKEKLVCLAWYDGGVRAFYNTQREIRDLEDYRGLKISVQRSSAMTELYTYLGAIVVPVPTNELYRSLQSGLIESVDDGIASYYIHRHYEIAKHLLYDSQYRIPEVLIASRMTMMQLSKRDQEIITESARESLNVQRQASLEMEKEAFQGLRDMGVLIHHMDSKDIDQLKEAAKTMYHSFRDEELNEILNY